MRFLLFFVFMAAMAANAQPDFGSSIAVPPIGSGIKTPSTGMPSTPSATTPAPSIFNNSLPSSSGLIPEKPINLNFGKTEKFANPGTSVAKKMNRREGEGTVNVDVRRNQYLGDVRTKSNTVKIVYRDYGAIDGDWIKILVNDKTVKESVVLDYNFEGFTLTLESGFNKIDFIALNEGQYTPNTAQFEIYDADGKVISSNYWDLGTGFKASIIVVKE